MGGKSIGGLIGCLAIAAGCACTSGASSGGRASPLPGEQEGNTDAATGVDSGLNGGHTVSGGSSSGSGTAGSDAGATPDATVSAGGPDAGPLASPAIHYLGRFDTRDPAGPRFAWPGSAIAATFRGTGIQVTLSDTGTNYFVVVVDGGAPTVLATSGDNKTYTLASNLTNAQHTVMLTKRTESNVGVVQLLGITPQGGALVTSPAPFTRRIEYVGDSITCGYGDLGNGPNCPFSPGTEDETIAYGALTAAQLNAQQTAIAYSGKGMYREYGGATANQMPVLFGLTLADDSTSTWGFSTPPPDVVVINLSSNDFATGDPGMPFQQAYVTFLRTLRQHYANAYVICTMSPLLDPSNRPAASTYISTAVQQVRAGGDLRVSTFTIPAEEGGTTLAFDTQLTSNGLGCDYHPAPKTHQLMAGQLVTAIRAITGW